MQDDRFDRLARFLARGRTRRRFVTLMAGAALAGAAPRASDAQDVCLVLNADCQFHGTPCCPPTECISDVFTGLGTCQIPTTATAQPAAPPTVSPAPAGASAAMWGGDPARTGVQPGPAPMSKPALAWSFATGGESAPPIIADGVVYAGSVTDPSQTGGGFFALDAATGSAHWSIAAPDSGNGWGPAAVAGGLVFVADQQGLHAFDAASGAERWHAAALKATACAVVDGLVYAGGEALLAFDAATGTERWRFLPEANPSGTAGYLSVPAVANGLVYAGSGTHRLYAVDAATGQEQWEITFLPVEESGDIAPSSAPVVADGHVYAVVHERVSVGVDRAFLWAVDAGTGQKQWAVETLGSSLGVGATQPAVGGGRIFAQGPDAAQANQSLVVALDAATGKERWRAAVPVTQSFNGSSWSGPALLGDTLLVTGAYVLQARNAATGKLHWSVATKQPQPAVVAASGGRLIVGGGIGQVEAFGAS